MLFNKSAVIFSALALCNVVVASQPPACLLSVVGSQPKPADFQAICVKNADKVQESIADRCDDDQKEALKFYANTCEANGHKVDISSSSTTTTTSSGSKSTSTGKNSQSTTASSSASSTTSGSDSGSGSSSSSDSSSSPSSSAPVSAGASDRQLSAAAFAAVVFVGFAATM